MWKKILILIIAIAIVLASKNYLSPKVEEHLHYHAGFRVYLDGIMQDYSDFKYMDLEPCSQEEKKKSKAEEQMEKAHLHDGVGDVVHVHAVGAVWGDLFQNIKATFPPDSKLVGYINGKKAENIMNTPINAYDSVIFIFGNDEASHSSEVVPIDHIKEVEVKSELCGVN